jgi:flagellar basal body-associated protein FliL
MKKKMIIFIFILSIIAAIVYILAIPHSTTVETIHTATEHSTITTYPLSHYEMVISTIKVFLLVNIPNYCILLYTFLHKHTM